jgi:L-lactate dehydrogenase complex protein LldE
MVTDKVRDIAGAKANTVLSGDLGCLLNIDGRLSREGVAVDARHVAEVLVEGGMDGPPIGGAA